MSCNNCKYKLYVSIGVRCPKAMGYYLRHWQLPPKERARDPMEAEADQMYVTAWTCELAHKVRAKCYEQFIKRMLAGDYIPKE